ncbi:MAG: D-alanyl-D-alanine carboxypeptidase [Clostridiales bacterium]|nr:D-alanyl-D-alanine carboxypeptidase [Clostridiales bacterium]
MDKIEKKRNRHTMSCGIARLLAFSLAVCFAFLFFVLPVSADVGQFPIELPPIEEVVCASYYVYDITKGEVVLEMDPDKRIYPASMTKIMTVVLALEYLDTDSYVTVNQTAMDATTPNSTMMGLSVDEEIMVRELLYGAMLPSGNDAANVLGESVAQTLRDRGQTPASAAGEEQKSLLVEFVDLMNRKAGDLGLANTHFMNTNGLHHDEHYTTARDLAVLFEHALQYDEFRTVINTPTHVYKATNKHTFDGWAIGRNTNYLLNDPWILGADSKVAKVVGGKTGTTIVAGTGMALFAVNKNGDEMISIVCGIPYDSANRQTTYVATVLNTGATICFDADPIVRIEGNVMNHRPYNAPAGLGPEIPEATEPAEPTETEPGTEPTEQTEPTTAISTDPGGESDGFDLITYLRENVIVAILGGLAILFIIAIVLLVIIPSVVRKKRRKRRNTSGFQGIRRI